MAGTFWPAHRPVGPDRPTTRVIRTTRLGRRVTRAGFGISRPGLGATPAGRQIVRLAGRDTPFERSVTCLGSREPAISEGAATLAPRINPIPISITPILTRITPISARITPAATGVMRVPSGVSPGPIGVMRAEILVMQIGIGVMQVAAGVMLLVMETPPEESGMSHREVRKARIPAGMSEAGPGALRRVSAVSGEARRMLPEGKRMLRRGAAVPRGRLLSALRYPGAGACSGDGNGVSYVVGDSAGTEAGKRRRLSRLGVHGAATPSVFVMLTAFVSQSVHIKSVGGFPLF